MRDFCNWVNAGFSDRLFVSVLCLAALMFLPMLGSYGIMDPSDGLYTEGAREMLESGNFLTPSFNYVPFLEKPILVYWLMICSFKLFGVSEFSARLPAALAAIETCCFVYLIGKEFLPRRAAFLGAVVLMSNLLFAVVGHLALTDMELTCFATVAILSFFQASCSSAESGRKYLVLAYFSIALTVLLKGPVMIVLCAIALLSNQLIMRVVSAGEHETFEHFFLRHRPILGAMIILIVAAPWFLTENLATHGAFSMSFSSVKTSDELPVR